MSTFFQRLLLAFGILALLALLIEIGLSVAATTHSNQPARVVHVTAGPYPLTVSLYKDPANAGFALPFAIAPDASQHDTLSYDVFSLPGTGVSATPVHASFSPDPNVRGGIQGDAEITVQGAWTLQITVHGRAGSAVVAVPITATAPPAIPDWLGWLMGLLPFYGLLIFLFTQHGKKSRLQEQLA